MVADELLIELSTYSWAKPLLGEETKPSGLGMEDLRTEGGQDSSIWKLVIKPQMVTRLDHQDTAG